MVIYKIEDSIVSAFHLPFHSIGACRHTLVAETVYLLMQVSPLQEPAKFAINLAASVGLAVHSSLSIPIQLKTHFTNAKLNQTLCPPVPWVKEVGNRKARF